MNALFVHDHRFFCHSNDVYSSGGLPSSVWLRYLNHFEELTIVGRFGGEISNIEGLTLSSTANVQFKLLSNFNSIFELVSDYLKLSDELTTLVKNSDFVIARVPSALGRLAVNIANKCKVPAVVEVVDCPFDGYRCRGGISNNFKARISKHLMQHLVKNTEYLSYVTEDFLQQRYPAKDTATVLACSNVELPPSIPDTIERRLLRISSSRKTFVLGQIGSLNGATKGFATSLKTVKALTDCGFDVEMRILGGGDGSHLIDLSDALGISEIVHFDGVLPSGPAVLEWLDELDIYIHPSHKEGLPRALLEAMSRGCPCVASNVAGIPELLPPEMMIEVNDFEAMSCKLKSLMKSNVLLREHALRNFQLSKKYEYSCLNKKRDAFYSSIKKIEFFK